MPDLLPPPLRFAFAAFVYIGGPQEIMYVGAPQEIGGTTAGPRPAYCIPPRANRP